MLFHAFYQRELGARPVQIVPVFFRLEINVSFQVVRQEADSRFQRDKQTAVSLRLPAA
ncbi:MAG: hypothetical protein ACLS9G_04585 [Akkermansia sp.]